METKQKSSSTTKATIKCGTLILMIFGLVLLSIQSIHKSFQIYIDQRMMMYTPEQTIITTKMTPTNRRKASSHEIDSKNDTKQDEEQYLTFEDDELLKRIASNEKLVSRLFHHYQQLQSKMSEAQSQPKSLSDLQRLQKQENQHHSIEFGSRMDNKNIKSTLEDINKSSSIDVIHNRPNGTSTNNNNDNALPIIFQQQDTMGNILSNDSSKTDITSNDKNYDQQHKARDHVHVMYGLSGHASGFIEEFTIS